MRYNGIDKETILDEVFTNVIQDYGCDLEELLGTESEEEIHDLLTRITYDITNNVIEERLKFKEFLNENKKFIKLKIKFSLKKLKIKIQKL